MARTEDHRLEKRGLVCLWCWRPGSVVLVSGEVSCFLTTCYQVLCEYGMQAWAILGDLLIKSLLHSGAPEVSSQFPSKGLLYKHRWPSTLAVKLHMSFGGGTNTQATGSLLSFCLSYGVCHFDFASQKTIWKLVAWNPNHFLLHLWFFRLTIKYCVHLGSH